jgi:hypothetical protein
VIPLPARVSLLREISSHSYPRPSSNRQQGLYYGLSRFPTPIFMERDAPKAHEACCNIAWLLKNSRFQKSVEILGIENV